MSNFSNPFIDFLIRQQPLCDEAILKYIAPISGWIKPRPWLDHLIEDARFLPKRLVSVYLLHKEKPNLKDWHIARRLGLKRKTVKNRLDRASDLIDDSLKSWLKTLPILERRRERYKRHKSWRDTRKFRVGESTLNRLRAVWPNVKSELPPVSKPNCSGEPCDP